MKLFLQSKLRFRAHPTRVRQLSLAIFLIGAWLLGACQPEVSSISASLGGITPAAPENAAPPVQNEVLPAPEPARPHYAPGELVDYTAQSGDTLPALAARFNTSVREIREANPVIPESATTMPPGMPMKIPIYYAPLWGSPYKIIPDSQLVYGPLSIGFDTAKFVADHPGWLKNYVGFVSGVTRNGAETVDYVAQSFSVSPRLLLALLEYQAGAVTNPAPVSGLPDYALGNPSWDHKGLYLQLTWAANLLNDGYSGWRTARRISMNYPDGREVRFDPWLNAATVSLEYYFNQIYQGEAYQRAVSSAGLAQTFQTLFGDPWQNDQPPIPASLTQPEMSLPFEPGYIWAFSGGPHTGWGTLEPYSALDFAPPSTAGGCLPSNEWATAVADGVVVRADVGVIILDLDGDGDERTGWDVLYLHLATADKVPLGSRLKRGDPVGHPSCEGGTATGTHVHVARKYNGEWIPADGVVPFNLDGWVAHYGGSPYIGTLTRQSQTVYASQVADHTSFIETGIR